MRMHKGDNTRFLAGTPRACGTIQEIQLHVSIKKSFSATQTNTDSTKMQSTHHPKTTNETHFLAFLKYISKMKMQNL
jgi:hypothetical protein